MRAAVCDGLPPTAVDLLEGAITWLGGVEDRLFAQVYGEGLWLSVAQLVVETTGGGAPFGIDGSKEMLADLGAEVWAVAQLAGSMLPTSFSGLLSGRVFH